MIFTNTMIRIMMIRRHWSTEDPLLLSSTFCLEHERGFKISYLIIKNERKIKSRILRSVSVLWSSLLGPWSGLLAAAALEEKRFQVVTNLHLFRICAGNGIIYML